MKGIIKILRPKQWLKNVFVFVPIFFGGSLLDTSDILSGIITFFAYSFAASSVYCFNDIIDVEADRKHPVKCHRAIASGEISIKQGYLLMLFMILLSIFTTFFLKENAWIVLGIILFYWIMNMAYCAKLKQYAIVDVCIIALGFVLRIFAGGVATGIVLSKWIVLMTFLLTLFLSFAKRRDDVLRMNDTGEAPRKNTIRYNLTFINQAITIAASVTLVCYIMYTVSSEVTANFHTDYLYLTSVFVLLGFLRYIQITVVDKRSGDPTKIMFRDRFTQIVVLMWILSFLIIIYLL
jgi:4-hydroxybenzoate polyprenyltransferase